VLAASKSGFRLAIAGGSSWRKRPSFFQKKDLVAARVRWRDGWA
jgi:hypothetical protein